MLMSTIHNAVNVEIPKVDRDGKRKVKPLAVYDYTLNMRAVDKADQMITYGSFLRKSVKWSKKVLIYLIQMICHNAFVLHRKYSLEKLSHEDFILHIANHLIQEGMKGWTLVQPDLRTYGYDFVQRDPEVARAHLPQEIPRKQGSKRKASRPCFACNGSWNDIRTKRLPKNCSGIWCPTCEKVLCIVPCFEIYHTHQDYKNMLLKRRFPNM